MTPEDFTEQEFEEKFYAFLLSGIYKNINASEIPVGYVLGGQPAAGKSTLINVIRQKNPNILKISGDDFRRLHPRADEIRHKYGFNSTNYTDKWAGKFVQALINKAIEDKKSMVIEGTFRTAENPLKTLAQLKTAGYQTEVHIVATPSEVSWQSTIERYQKEVQIHGVGRAVDREKYNITVNNLPDNVATVYARADLYDRFIIRSREKLLFDSSQNPNQNPIEIIKNQLAGKVIK